MSWRTVHIVGKLDPKDIPPLKKAIIYTDDADFHCLMAEAGVMGLSDWAKSSIDVIGNLAERDYDVHTVANTLRKLATIAPSLEIKVHVGEDNESQDCEATVTLTGGEVTIGRPEVSEIGIISTETMKRNMVIWMSKLRG